MAGRLPIITLPYSSPRPAPAAVPEWLLPAAERLDTSGVVVVVDADEAAQSSADCPMFIGGRLPFGGGSPDMFAAPCCWCGVGGAPDDDANMWLIALFLKQESGQGLARHPTSTTEYNNIFLVLQHQQQQRQPRVSYRASNGARRSRAS